MKRFLLLFTFIHLAAQAQTVLVDRLHPSRTTHTVHFNGLPSFFFKVSADGKYLSYTLPSSSPQGPINVLHHVESGAVSEVPGPWDPVFNVNAELMTLPIQPSQRSFHYGIYRVSDILIHGRAALPLFEDTTLGGVYQSVGILHDSGSHLNFRVITELGVDKHSLRDYSYDRAAGTVAPLSEVRRLCTNQILKLPMLSKDGREIGGIDMSDGKSAIFRIENDGTCTKVFSLGLRTGKMNFSHDSSQIVFHIFSSQGDRVSLGFVSNPSADYTSDIYLLDRTTGHIQPLARNEKANALYPDFLRDGRVVYAHYPHEEKRVEFRFLELLPEAE